MITSSAGCQSATSLPLAMTNPPSTARTTTIRPMMICMTSVVSQKLVEGGQTFLVQLAHPGFRETQGEGDFLHVQFVLVIERDQQAFPLGHLRQSLCQRALYVDLLHAAGAGIAALGPPVLQALHALCLIRVGQLAHFRA